MDQTTWQPWQLACQRAQSLVMTRCYPTRNRAVSPILPSSKPSDRRRRLTAPSRTSAPRNQRRGQLSWGLTASSRQAPVGLARTSSCLPSISHQRILKSSARKLSIGTTGKDDGARNEGNENASPCPSRAGEGDLAPHPQAIRMPEEGLPLAEKFEQHGRFSPFVQCR